MNLETLKSQLPEYGKDTKLNLGGLERIESLTKQQLYGAMLASAAACRNAEVLRAVDNAAKPHLDENARKAALTAASLMAMNNVYYRFLHLVSDKEYGKLPAQLRMQAMANPGVDKLDFELWSLAVSAINGCGMCMDSHEQNLRKHGATREAVQAVVRVAAVIHATVATLEAEAALSANVASA